MLPEAPALQLLLRAAPRKPVLEPSHPDHGVALAVCRLLGGLPLALEIAGAFLSEWPEVSLADFRQRLHRDGRLATLDAEGEELSTTSQRGLHAAAVDATLSEQWNALATGKPVDEDARLLLRIAGQLPEVAQIPAALLELLSGFEHTAPGVPGRLSRSLRRLVRASLIEELHSAELRLHPLVREFAQSKTAAVDTPTFRRTCALNLLGAYQDVTELERQCALRGVEALEADLNTALHLVPVGEDAQHYTTMLQQLLRIVRQESHVFRSWQPPQQPALFRQQWRKRALINREPRQASAATVALGRLSVPYLELLWTTAEESGALERTLSGHTGWVRAVAVAPDKWQAVSASEDHMVKVWDLWSGVVLHTFTGHSDSVNAVAVTSDGQRAISASGDRTLKVWDLAGGTELHTLIGHLGTLYAVAVTPDGQRAISASSDRTLKVWDLTSGTALHTLIGHSSSVIAVAVTVDGQRAVSASEDGTLKVWDLNSGATLHTLIGHTDL